MRLHQTQSQFNAGIDLHTKEMYLCLCGQDGTVLVHRKIRNNDLSFLLKLLKPYLHDLTVCCESTVNWYFLHDFCTDQNIEFVLGHALYIRAISQNKTKTDHADSLMLANLLRTNMLPVGYTMAAELRNVRELMRRRMRLVNKRSSFKASLTSSIHMHGLGALTKVERTPRNREGAMKSRSDNQVLVTGWDAYLSVIDAMDQEVAKLERAIMHYTRELHKSRDLELLMSFPGIGQTLGLVILLEIGELSRFPAMQDFSSYARLIVPDGISADKKCGKRGGKIGNPYLKWAFTEAAVTMPRWNPSIRSYMDQLEKKHSKRKAKHILAHRIGRAVFQCLTKNQRFDIKEFLKGKEKHIVTN